MESMNYHNMSKAQIFRLLDTCENGLSENEASKRLKKYGLNQLSSPKKKSILLRFLMQFNDFMTLILIGSAIISLVISFLNNETDIIEPIIIMSIVCLNGFIGVVQESKAEAAIESLKKMSALSANVLRNKQRKKIPASQLVPGDIIYLETGDMIPADCYILNSTYLTSDESSLTGESIPCEKKSGPPLPISTPVAEQSNILHSSCIICSGRGIALVTSTGHETQVGQIATMIMNDEAPQTPIQKRLAHIGKILGITCIAICVFLFIFGIIKGFAPFEMFMTSVSLAVAAIPEGLTIIVTIMLSIGVTKMSRTNAIVRNLPAVETLGTTSCICSDKTGTLTLNSMTVTDIRNGQNKSDTYTIKKILNQAVLCCNSTQSTGDATEQAIIKKASSLGITTAQNIKEDKRVYEIPFDSTRKIMTTVTKLSSGKYLVVTKGAFDIIIKLCNFNSDNISKNGLEKINNNMAQNGLRVIAIATKELSSYSPAMNKTLEENLSFSGFIGMIDPPRPGVPESIHECKNAGIKTVMITGDHPITALSIAKDLKITSDNNVITGNDLNSLSDQQLKEAVKKCNVFARVTPAHKVRIVKAFQSNGHITAMTGDGVNDAPALKISDIGCSMGKNGTDVARNASDIILTDDNFTTIVKAIREGRRIHCNIKKTISFLLSSNIGEILTICVAIFLNLPSPLTAIQLLWINLVTDSLPAISLGMEPEETDIMKQPPVKDPSKIFNKEMVASIVFQGLMIGSLALTAFWLGFKGIGNNLSNITDSGSLATLRLSHGRTMAFAVLGLSQLFHSFNMKSKYSLFTTGILNNPKLILSFIICFILQVMVLTLPPLQIIFGVVSLSLLEWCFVLILSIVPILLVEIQKIIDKHSQI